MIRYEGEETNLVLPDGITIIESEAFKDSSVTSVTLPNSIKEIKDSAFANDKTLTSCNFPDGLEYIGECAFANTGIISIHIPDSVTYIGNGAFKDCASLRSVGIDGMPETGGDLFTNCSAIRPDVDNPNLFADTCDHNGNKCNIMLSKPSCTFGGESCTICYACGHSEVIKHEASGHKYIYDAATVQPTCTQDGTLVERCEVCQNRKTTVIPKFDHPFGEEFISKQPTCTNEGTKSHTCQMCGLTEVTEIIPATGHTYVPQSAATFSNDSVAMDMFCIDCTHKIKPSFYWHSNDPDSLTQHTAAGNFYYVSWDNVIASSVSNASDLTLSMKCEQHVYFIDQISDEPITSLASYNAKYALINFEGTNRFIYVAYSLKSEKSGAYAKAIWEFVFERTNDFRHFGQFM